MIPGFLFDSLPWWLAAPTLQLGLLVFGMALDETYVNRATVITGTLALYTHVVVGGGAWLPVGLYLDAGVVLGVYGLYAYVVDAYVPNWFRVLAFFAYSPLSILLVIVFPDIVFPVALALAAFANLQLMDYLAPNEPYYFGPESPGAVAIVEDDDSAEGDAGASDPADDGTDGAGVTAATSHERGREEGVDRPGSDPTATGGEPTERGILPEFMRRL